MRVPLPIPTDCHGCGVCCRGQEALPVGYWLGPLAAADGRWLPSTIRAELVALRERFDRVGWPADGSDCVWYDADARRCRHHEHRPSICAEFEVGGADCRHRREEYRAELVALLRVMAANARARALLRPGGKRLPFGNQFDGR